MELTQTMLAWASQIPTGLVALLQLVGIVFLAFWFYWRAGSAHVFWVRIWALIHGKGQVSDAVIGPWITKRSALMQFRVHSGVRARTHAEGIRLIEWAERNNEEMGDIAKCRWLFDLAKPGLKPKVQRRWHVACLALAAFVLLFGTSLAVLLTLAPRPLVSVKNGSGATMLLSADNIKPFWSSEKFDAGDCRLQPIGTIAERVGLPRTDVAVACGWLEEPGYPAQVAKTLHNQRVGGASLTGLGLIYISFPLTWLMAIVAAMSMAKRLAQPAASPQQAAEQRDPRILESS